MIEVRVNGYSRSGLWPAGNDSARQVVIAQRAGSDADAIGRASGASPATRDDEPCGNADYAAMPSFVASATSLILPVFTS